MKEHPSTTPSLFPCVLLSLYSAYARMCIDEYLHVWREDHVCAGVHACMCVCRGRKLVSRVSTDRSLLYLRILAEHRAH